jgi:hypothetical protein
MFSPKNRWVKDPLNAFSISIAIFSLLLSIHTDIFEQQETALTDIFTQPFRSFFNPEPSVNLSDLLIPAPKQNPSGQEVPKDKNSGPLYVFALDRSKSMSSRRVSEAEFERYKKNLENSAQSRVERYRPFCLLPGNSTKVTLFDIALNELCRYMYLIPDGSNAAIYTFGDKPQRQWPEADKKQKYFMLKTEEGEVNNRDWAKLLLPQIQADHGNTDFEKLFNEFAIEYEKAIKKENPEISEVHFVIISDFAHDIGGGRPLREFGNNANTLGEATEWESKYRASEASIIELLREIGRPGVATFHLAAVSGTRSTICAILPIVDKTLEIYSYRETQLTPSNAGREFDFLRSYEASSNEITFYYAPGRFKPFESRIIVDNEKYANTDIRFALASEAGGTGVYPLKIQVTFKGNQNPGVVGLYEGGHGGKMERPHDEIILEPLSTLEPREAAAYRLLVSWRGQTGKDDEAERKTFVVKIKFYRRLSWYTALSIMLSGAFTLVFGVTAFYRRFWGKQNPPGARGKGQGPLVT